MIQAILIILFSLPIFYSSIYRLLLTYLDLGWAYVIDFFLPITVTSILAILIIRNIVPRSVLKNYLRFNLWPLVIIAVTTFVVHGWIMGNYFLGEGWGHLRIINEPSLTNSGDPGLSTNLKLHILEGVARGWHNGVMILSWLLFWNKAEFYNLITLILFALTAIVVYVFLNMLFSKKPIPALVGTLFFITTPAYTDMFNDIMNSSGMPIALAAAILSLIFLLLWLRKSKLGYYLLSLLFYLSALKLSFVRIHPFAALPLFLCYFGDITSGFKNLNIKRFVIYGSPYILILLSYILAVFLLQNDLLKSIMLHLFFPKNSLDVASKLQGDIHTPHFPNNYYVSLSALTAYLFVPSQFAEVYYPKIRPLLALFPFIPQTSITVLLGSLGLIFLLAIGLVAFINIKKTWGKIAIFSLLTLFAHIIFNPFFNTRHSDPIELDRATIFSGTASGFGPGSRYVFVASFGLAMLISLATMLILNKKWVYKKIIYFALLSLLFVYYAELDITSHKHYVLEESNPGRVLTDNVFNLVPHDRKKKLVYSTNPELNTIDKKPGAGPPTWLYTFYKINELEYTNSKEEVKQKLEARLYERENFYAFYTNNFTNSFVNTSDLVWNELTKNPSPPEEKKNIFAGNLSEIFTPSDKRSFLFAIANTETFYTRLYTPKKLTILTNTRPYSIKPTATLVSGNNDSKTWQGSPFPIPLWNKFESKKSDSLWLAYACAEDQDWEKQQKQETVLGGIWYVIEYPLKAGSASQKLSIDITCFGSILRRIVFVGSPEYSDVNIKANLSD